MTDEISGRYLFHTASKNRWKEVTAKRRSGIAVPLFSVYSKKSLGVGDLEDLKLLVDWCNISGNSIIQLLPMNEAGSLFCPYDSISSFALEPMYISLYLVPSFQEATLAEKIRNIRDCFPQGRQYLDYGIKKEKTALLWEIFLREDCESDPKFKKFTADNSYWLLDFALYKALKDCHMGSAWYDWPQAYKDRDKDELDNFFKSHHKEIIFQMWVQWQLYIQFQKVKRYAKSKGVLIKGDLPILVSRDSADVWAHPEFFKLEYAAGAPPDMYCAKGQRWGMPTYNWDRIAADDFRYLKEKLRYAENFYDILRIDHVVGLFRIWSISFNEPLENKGLYGFFDPKDESKWKEHGRRILSVIIENTKMLLCAEDLGIIPKSCPETLKELGIPGNDVQRWVKDWDVRHDFLIPDEYRRLSVAMLSTHDTTNWPAWWEYEAGTVDEALFMRKCAERQIDYSLLKDKLFEPVLSRYGRLRWQDEIISSETLVNILGKKKEEVKDFIEMYNNTYKEKEKLWKLLNLEGDMREEFDSRILKAVLKFTLESQAIFCVNLLMDWLFLTDIFKGDPYQYRINTPSTVSPKNWSLTIPISLEELLEHKVNPEIKEMILSSGRV